MSQWYYAHDGKQSGPVPISELERLAANGEFDPQKDLVWQEGLPDWKPASTVPELGSLMPGAAAATPTPSPASPKSPEPMPTTASPAQASPYSAPSGSSAPSSQPAPAPASNVPPSNGLAIAALICGLIALLSCFLWCLSIPLALGGIICGHLALSKIKKDPARNTGRGLALTGTIAGYLALVMNVAFIGIVGFLSTQTPEQLEELGVPKEFIEQMETQRQLQQQLQEQMEEQSQ